jgi:hypothetical protein
MNIAHAVCAAVVLLAGSAAAQDGVKAIQKTAITLGTATPGAAWVPAFAGTTQPFSLTYFFTSGQAGSGGPNASSPEILVRIL